MTETLEDRRKDDKFLRELFDNPDANEIRSNFKAINWATVRKWHENFEQLRKDKES